MFLLISQIAKKAVSYFHYSIAVISLILSLAFAFGLMFSHKNDTIDFSNLYDFVFLPYLIFSVISIPVLALRYFLKYQNDKNLLLSIFIGSVVLAVCGIFDMIILLEDIHIVPFIESPTAIGAMVFSSIMIYIFTEKLIGLIQTHQESLKLLQSAYKDLDNARSIISAGKSTVIINHEIKNHLFSIIYYIEKMLTNKELPEHTRSLAKMTLSTINELLFLNYDLLDLTKKRLIDTFPKIEIARILQQTITPFNKEKQRIVLENSTKEYFMYGDEKRICNIFSNLLKHILMISDNVKITFLKDSFVLLITFTLQYDQDKPSGKQPTVNEDLLYSSVRSIFESYGGNVTLVNDYKNNSLDSIYITIPNYIDTPTLQDKEKDPIVLIKEGLTNFDKIIQIFRNVFVNPHVISNQEELGKRFDMTNHKIIGSTKTVVDLKNKFPLADCFSIYSGPHSELFVAQLDNKNAEFFSELFILNNLLQFR